MPKFSSENPKSFRITLWTFIEIVQCSRWNNFRIIFQLHILLKSAQTLPLRKRNWIYSLNTLNITQRETLMMLAQAIQSDRIEQLIRQIGQVVVVDAVWKSWKFHLTSIECMKQLSSDGSLLQCLRLCNISCIHDLQRMWRWKLFYVLSTFCYTILSAAQNYIGKHIKLSVFPLFSLRLSLGEFSHWKAERSFPWKSISSDIKQQQSPNH